MVQTAVARGASVPGDYERAELLSQQKERVLFGELSTMEAFLEDLRLLCSCLKKHCQEIKNECEAVVERRDQVKAIAVEAEHIEKLYVQLHQAEKELQMCETESKMQALAELTRKLPAVLDTAEYVSAHGGCIGLSWRKQRKSSTGCRLRFQSIWSRSRLQQGQRSCRRNSWIF